MTGDTIAALATPPGLGGVGIVRISGPHAATIAHAMLGRVPEPRYAAFGVFRDHAGTFIDEGLALYFPAPHSFTGEDVLELQGHGGPVVLDLILRRCLELGARLARPGEFSERAFLNGKLDLIQAEAVADLIESSTALAVRLAGRNLQGVFSRRIDELVEQLIQIRLHVEATLDFPDEDIDLADEPTIATDLAATLARVHQLLTDAHHGQIIREGLAVVIAGVPNVGKSSLLNALCGTEAAIVTDIPGTTRDLLKFDIQVDGLPIRLVDTAGLRHTQDPIEQEGVRRAHAAAHEADVVLWVYAADSECDETLRDSFPAGCPIIRVRNKIDLLNETAHWIERDGEVEIALSVASGDGLELLKTQLKAQAGLNTAHPEGIFMARRRHLDALERTQTHLQAAATHLEHRCGAELVAEELQLAQRTLGEITGEFTTEDLLGRIFADFCLGK